MMNNKESQNTPDIDLDALEQKALAMKGWENINATMYNPDTDYIEVGTYDEDGNWYDLLRVNAEQYTDDQGDDATVAEYYASVSNGVILELIRRLREAEKKRFTIDADWLANVIRSVDGNHHMGAGVLAEKIVQEIDADVHQDAAHNQG
jgi:hypothetical protein